MYEEYNLPNYDGTPQNIQIYWTSKPTEEQRTMIQDQNREVSGYHVEHKLRDFYNEELDTEVQPYMFKRGDFPTQIINRAIVETTGIYGINALQTCKQIHSEAREILYSENTFVFNTRGTAPFTHHRGVHEHDTLSSSHNLIPGLANADGTPASGGQIRWAIDRMFQQGAHPKFIFRDPLTKFFSEIGRTNASLISKAKIEGYFKTAEDHWRFRNERPVGLARILSIHTTVLSQVCHDLRELTIHVGSNNELWDDDLQKQSCKTDEERIDNAIEKVASSLPGLQKLQLGHYRVVPSSEEDAKAWGTARRWMGIVERRHRGRKRQLLLEEERRAKRIEKRELEQYIWRDDSAAGHKGHGQRHTQRQAVRGNPFDALIDNALAAASESGEGTPSFRKGKKNRRG